MDALPDFSVYSCILWTKRTKIRSHAGKNPKVRLEIHDLYVFAVGQISFLLRGVSPLPHKKSAGHRHPADSFSYIDITVSAPRRSCRCGPHPPWKGRHTAAGSAPVLPHAEPPALRPHLPSHGCQSFPFAHCPVNYSSLSAHGFF